MRKTFALLVMLVAASAAWTQTGSTGQSSTTQPSTAQSAPPAKPATAAKPVVHAATKPTAVIKTTAGDMTCTLFPDKAPIGVANFVGLASGTKDWKSPVSGATKHGVPLYDGTIFHRVIPEFMIQGGDPAGTGSGADPVAPFKNEVSSELLFDRPGRLAYANAGRDTNSSQFFITEKEFTGQQGAMLNGNYTIFGQCDEASVELVKKIARMNRDPSNDKPFRPVKIIHIAIVRSTGAGANPAAGTTVKKPATATPKPAPSSN
jgi:peptidyl-prolyl cis-trans isomerase A (cyclophilin A)